MTAFRAVFRYELRMQLRKPSVWITLGALGLLTALSPGNLATLFDEDDPKAAAIFAATLVMLFLPVGFGCLVADRLIRDEHLGVRQVLDATPGGLGTRLAGKYLGACLATGLPIVAAFLVLVAAYAARHGDPAVLATALPMIIAVLVPALLFVGAFAMLCPLVMPAPLFRVLFVGYWFWTNLVAPELMFTLNRTVVNPVNGYAIDVLIRAAPGNLAGPVPGAALNLLRPAPSTAWAVLSIAVLLAMAALALTGARSLLARATR